MVCNDEEVLFAQLVVELSHSPQNGPKFPLICRLLPFSFCEDMTGIGYHLFIESIFPGQGQLQWLMQRKRDMLGKRQ